MEVRICLIFYDIFAILSGAFRILQLIFFGQNVGPNMVSAGGNLCHPRDTGSAGSSGGV